jgi:hypothetical protein
MGTAESAFGQDQDDTVVVPFTTVQKRFHGVTHLIDRRHGGSVRGIQRSRDRDRGSATHAHHCSSAASAS